MQVFIVSGGKSIIENCGQACFNDTAISSTETWTRGSTSWTPAADLPSPRYSLAGVTIGGQFFITGEPGIGCYDVVNNVMYDVYIQVAAAAAAPGLRC